MKIKRTVNGTEMEFELTEIELYSAYVEQQDKLDRIDIEDYLRDISDEELMDDYGKTRAEAEELIDEMASRLRRYIDNYDCEWSYARSEAVHEVLSMEKKEK